MKKFLIGFMILLTACTTTDKIGPLANQKSPSKKINIDRMELKIYPDPILRQKCTDVSPGDPLVSKILEKMSKKLYEWNGVGLAAPQVGILKKIVVIDVGEKTPMLYKMINPKIIRKSQKMIQSIEGCLSLPRVQGIVLRHEKVVVEYLDENFEKKVLEGEGLLSRCIQHELDHLDGKLYIDRVSR